MTRGKLITLEGAEGVGKSSNLGHVVEYLRARGTEAVTTREPGGTLLGERIRSILLDHATITADAELLLFFAARAQHIQQLIVPTLDQGKWVICDRFTDASYAYQGGGRGINERHIHYLEGWIQDQCQPELTLLFDAPVELGLSRIRARREPDRIESEKIAFFERVRRTYQALASHSPDRIKIIDATKPLAEVQAEINRHLESLLAHGSAN